MRTEHVVHVYHCTVNGMLFCHTPCPCHLHKSISTTYSYANSATLPIFASKCNR